MKNKSDEYYMMMALKEAAISYQNDEVPVGCVIVSDGKVIAKAHNIRQKNHDVFGHAEVIAIKKACKKIQSWILDDATIYITLEPCIMCAGAILQSRIKRVVYGTSEPKFGAIESILNIFDPSFKFNHKVDVKGGICKDEASKMLKDYFKEKRQKNNNDKK